MASLDSSPNSWANSHGQGGARSQSITASIHMQAAAQGQSPHKEAVGMAGTWNPTDWCFWLQPVRTGAGCRNAGIRNQTWLWNNRLLGTHQLSWGQEVHLSQWKESGLAVDTAKAGPALGRPGKKRGPKRGPSHRRCWQSWWTDCVHFSGKRGCSWLVRTRQRPNMWMDQSSWKVSGTRETLY